MHRVLSTHLFVQQRLTTALLDRLQRAGIEAVEIFLARQHLDYRNRSQVNEIVHWFRDSGMELHSLHAPMYSDEVWGRSGPDALLRINEPSKIRRIAAVDEIKRALEITEYVPVRYVIQHLGAPGEEFDEHCIDAAFSSLEELSVFVRQRGAELLLENIPNGFSSPERLIWFLNFTKLELGLCFDTGHANLQGGVLAAFETMKERIRSTHVHDNDGTQDNHLLPVLSPEGKINWNELMEKMRSHDRDLPLVLELRQTPDMTDPIGSALRVFEELEKL